MPVGPNDVNVNSIATSDEDVRAGDPFDVTVEAEAGSAIHGTGGLYHIAMTLTDTTNPALLLTQTVDDNYTAATWPAPGRQVFTFNVPAGTTTGREDSILELQARVVSNATPPFDASHALSETILVTK